MRTMSRDQQIAALIRQEIAAIEVHIVRCGYRPASLERNYQEGKISGLRTALAFVDPNPRAITASFVSAASDR